MKSSDKIPAFLLEANPHLPIIHSAIEAFKNGMPVDQIWPDSGEMLIVEYIEESGSLIVRAGNKIVYRSKRSVPPDNDRHST